MAQGSRREQAGAVLAQSVDLYTQLHGRLFKSLSTHVYTVFNKHNKEIAGANVVVCVYMHVACSRFHGSHESPLFEGTEDGDAESPEDEEADTVAASCGL